MIIRYSYRKQGIRTTTTLWITDIHTVYDDSACNITDFLLYSVVIVFDYSLSICNCVPSSPGDGRKVALGLTNKPDRLNILLLIFFFFLFSVEYFAPWPFVFVLQDFRDILGAGGLILFKTYLMIKYAHVAKHQHKVVFFFWLDIVFYFSLNSCYCEEQHFHPKLLRGRTCLKGLQWKCPPVHMQLHQDGPAFIQAALCFCHIWAKPAVKIWQPVANNDGFHTRCCLRSFIPS